jgi:hypothetical protein
VGDDLRLIRVDPDTPGFRLSESACHTECLRGHLPSDVPLTFHRHWNGKAPLLDDDADIDGQPCAMCGRAIAPAKLVRLRVQKPVGTVKAPEFDEQTLPFTSTASPPSALPDYSEPPRWRPPPQSLTLELSTRLKKELVMAKGQRNPTRKSASRRRRSQGHAAGTMAKGLGPKQSDF